MIVIDDIHQSKPSVDCLKFGPSSNFTVKIAFEADFSFNAACGISFRVTARADMKLF